MAPYLDFQQCIWVWVLAYVALYVYMMRSNNPGVGLTFAYYANLAINHFFGAVVNELPWFTAEESEATRLGFSITTLGLIAFVVGAVFGGSALFRLIMHVRPVDSQKTPDKRLPKAYIITGLVCYVFLQPLLGKIPSIGILAASGWSLMIVGVCLAAWKAGVERGKKILRWLLISIAFPFVTVVNSGFLGFGISALISILSFVGVFYRPRWKVLLASIIAVYMGLSVFVTYFRDRELIRETVWYEKQSLFNRSQKLYETFSAFELFDIRNEVHLKSIDGRLNQNWLVGMSAIYINANYITFVGGRTFYEALLAVIPRILWPDKPVYGGSGSYVSDYTGVQFAEGTSVGIGQTMEFYINFGLPSVMIGFLILGSLTRLIDIMARLKLRSGNWKGFVFWFLPGLALLQAGGSLIEVVSTFAASLIYCFLVNKYVLPHMSGTPFRLERIIHILKGKNRI